MPISIYDVSVPVFRQMLECQIRFLHKAAAHAESKNIDPMYIAGARLSRNSHAYGQHVRSMCLIANQAMAQLGGEGMSKPQPTERGFPAITNKLKPEKFETAESKMLSIGLSNSGAGEVTAQELLLHFVMPNFLPMRCWPMRHWFTAASA
jgi:hypothetical protein